MNGSTRLSYEHAFEHAGIPMALLSLDGRVLTANDALCVYLGHARDAIERTRLSKFSHPLDIHLGRRERRDALRGRCTSFETETRLMRADQRVVTARVTTSLVRDAGGAPWFFVAVLRDITAEKKSAELMRELTLVDELTSLRNRRGFDALADHVRARALRDRQTLLLLFIDVDRFKAINDQFGHAAGDTALKTVADLLRAAFREVDVIARLGGDEFAVLLTCEPSETSVVVERLRNRFAWFNASRALPFELSISIGTASAEPTSVPVLTEMLATADAALYEEKRRRTSALRRNA